MIGHGTITGFRRTLGGLLLALLLVVWHAPLLAVVFASAMDCGTSCCRKKKNCCCRKKASPASARAHLRARNCPPGCGQPTVLPVNLLGWAAPSLTVAFVVPILVPLLALPMLVVLTACSAFALFQRPPPALSRLAIVPAF